MASQKAIVASVVSAVPEIVNHGKTGVLVPPKDSEALTLAIARLLPIDALRKWMGKASRDLKSVLRWRGW